MLRTSLTSQAIDDVLAGTFPASDPPAWTPGIARLAPEIATGAAVESGEDDISRPTDSKRTFVQALVSLPGATGIALLVLFLILAVASQWLVVRALPEIAQWFLAMIR